ncbi:MAG: hypothetical protein EOO59_18125, partial [Hymenobacter sp.]
RAVEKKLNECLKNDRARIQVGRISPFGLLEMSRQRIRTGMLESSSLPCVHCGGSGFVRATASVALQILRAIEESLLKSASHNLVLRTRTEAALYILNQKRGHLHELEGHLPRMEQILHEGGDIRLNAQGELVVTPLTAAEVPASAQALAAQVGPRLPLVELSELLGEVDAWTGFSRVLLGPEPAAAQRALLYAALLAAACNIPLTDMARSTGLDYQALWWVASSYLREDALKQATTCLVNYQYHQPLAAAWGGGTLSSSDGQRFPVRGHVRAARALPRYYGYGQGLTFYTHTADQYAQFGSRAIASTVRDATYVLDEVLGNETELPLLEHTTDTHGYTDLVFALFDLLGLRFSPRLRDLKDQRLCKIQGRDLVYPSLKFTARFHPE